MEPCARRRYDEEVLWRQAAGGETVLSVACATVCVDYDVLAGADPGHASRSRVKYAAAREDDERLLSVMGLSS